MMYILSFMSFVRKLWMRMRELNMTDSDGIFTPSESVMKSGGLRCYTSALNDGV